MPLHKINMSVHKINILWHKSVHGMALNALSCSLMPLPPPIFGDKSKLCLVTKTKIGLLCQTLITRVKGTLNYMKYGGNIKIERDLKYRDGIVSNKFNLTLNNA